MTVTPMQVLRGLYAFADAGAEGIVCMTLTLRACDEAAQRYRWYLQTLGPFAPEPLVEAPRLVLDLSR